MQRNHMGFGIDRRGIAIVATPLSQWPHKKDPGGFSLHFTLDLLATKGRQYTSRALGDLTLGFLNCHHRDTMAPYVFAPLTPSPLVDPSSNVEQLVVDRGAILPIHVALGLTEDGQSLEFSENSDAHQALPGTVRSTPLRELEARGPDGTAVAIGKTCSTR